MKRHRVGPSSAVNRLNAIYHFWLGPLPPDAQKLVEEDFCLAQGERERHVVIDRIFQRMNDIAKDSAVPRWKI